MYNQRLGKLGEHIACTYLQRLGYTVLEQNYRTRHGEIDIICMHDEELIFVEVKTRSSTAVGYPENALNKTKISHLIAALETYLLDTSHTYADYRLDVVAIVLTQPSPTITHIRNISS